MSLADRSFALISVYFKHRLRIRIMTIMIMIIIIKIMNDDADDNNNNKYFCSSNCAIETIIVMF